MIQGEIRRKHVTIREHHAMRRLRAEGVTLMELAAQFGRGDSTVHRHVHDVPPPPQGWVPACPKRRFDRKLAADLAAKGLTYAEIGERLGVTGPAVHKALQKMQREQAA
jgi:IS30 family transposase